MEKFYRDEFLKRFQPDHANFTAIELPIQYPAWVGHRNGLNQAGIWFGSVMALMALIDDDSTVEFGYIREDDWMVHRHVFEEIFQRFCSVYGLERCKLEIPFANVFKKGIVDDILVHDLQRYVWWCEEEDTRECGVCQPCKKLVKALGEIFTETNVNPFTTPSHSRLFIDLFRSHHKKMPVALELLPQCPEGPCCAPSGEELKKEDVDCEPRAACEEKACEERACEEKE
jgi:hypothetical protein